MSEVNLQLVREFFELNLFQVMTPWQAPTRRGGPDAAAQLFVQNTGPVRPMDLGQLIYPVDLAHISRAVVEIRAWHGERLYPSVLENSPVLSQFAEPEHLGFAEEVFGGNAFKTILIVSELPVSPEQRSRVIQMLKDSPVDHVLEFASILRDLLGNVSVNDTYTGSITLETIRLLKKYRLVQNQQMEFPFGDEAPVGFAQPNVDTSAVDESEE